VDAMAVRFIGKSQPSTSEWLKLLPEQQPSVVLIELLFAQDNDNWQSVLVSEALIASAPSYPKVQALLHDWYEVFILSLAQALVREHPEASSSACWEGWWR